MDILVISDRDARAIRASLRRLERAVRELSQKGDANFMALKDDLDALAARMEAGIANLTDDIRNLGGAIDPDGMTADQAAAVKARLEVIAQGLEALAAQTPDAPAA